MTPPQHRREVQGVERRSYDPNALIDTKTAAGLLGLTNHHTLEVWRSTKRYSELRYHRIGRAIRYRVADLEAFLAGNCVGAPRQRPQSPY